MRIALSKNCPIFHPNNEIYLHSLLRTVVNRWNSIVAPAPSELASAMPAHVWLSYRTILTKAYRSAVDSTQSWAVHRDCSRCDPVKMATFYSLPTLLIVENAHTDGEWVKMIAQKLRPAVLRALTGLNPAMTIAQAGGIDEIPKEIRRLAKPYVANRPDDQLPLRVLAMADSDARTPGAISGSAREVMKVASEVGALSIILKKRSIENYIPDDSLYAYAVKRRDRMGAVRQITALPAIARNHYPLKTGLSESERASSEIYPPNLPLNVGMGDFALDFLENFQHEVTATDLLKRDGNGELLALLSEMEKNL